MPHKHRLLDNRETGIAIIDPEDDIFHYHMVMGQRTSNSLMKENHTHIIDNLETSVPIEEGKSAMSTKPIVETKEFHGYIKNAEIKERDIDGVRIGEVSGYIATWDIDRGDMFGIKDQFVRGAFRESIADHLKRNRMIRFKDHHGRTVGGWVISSVHEDDIGLFGTAHINLDVKQGSDAMSLIRQKVLTDFSIGFSADEWTIDGTLRTITKATIWEGSIVDEPMNPFANVVGFKNFKNMQVSATPENWNPTEAMVRVKEFADNDLSVYESAFVHGLLVADIVDEKMVVIPEALKVSAEMVMSETFPTDRKADAIKHIERYYAKMNDVASPFAIDEKMFFVLSDVKEITPTELQKALNRGASFNKTASKFLVSRLKNVDKDIEPEDNTAIKSLFDSIKATEL